VKKERKCKERSRERKKGRAKGTKASEKEIIKSKGNTLTQLK
jgi:hypothetical protein